MHQPVHRQRMLPAEALVDALGAAFGVDQQVFGTQREAKRRSAKRRIRSAGAGGRPRLRRDRLGEGRLVAEPAGRVDGAQQHLQHMDCAAGMETVGMRRDAAHRMHRDRAADHLVMGAPGPVRPLHVQLDGLLEGRVS